MEPLAPLPGREEVKLTRPEVAEVTADPTLAERWVALGSLPEGSLGRRVWPLSRARGFTLPGRPRVSEDGTANRPRCHPSRGRSATDPYR